jgi:hypothetical protein
VAGPAADPALLAAPLAAGHHTSVVVADKPLADLPREGIRVLDAAEAAGVVLRAVGGVAVWLTCPSGRIPPLARPYKDLDLVVPGGLSEPITDLLISLGYEPAEHFNKLHGHQRLYFWDPANRRQLDIFVRRFAMCHQLDLGDRLELVPRTVPLSDLLLTKLQVVEVNERDLKDAAAILADHPVAPGGIDPERVVEVLAGDWGWWRTATATLDATAAYVDRLDRFEGTSTVLQTVETLRGRVDAAPKGARWRLRAIVGERVRWYELPEEIGT